MDEEQADVRANETVDTNVATKKVEPWIPKGLEAVWSKVQSNHPDFMDIRRKEYETQIDASIRRSSVSGGFVDLLKEQGRIGQSHRDFLVSGN